MVNYYFNISRVFKGFFIKIFIQKTRRERNKYKNSPCIQVNWIKWNFFNNNNSSLVNIRKVLKKVSTTVWHGEHERTIESLRQWKVLARNIQENCRLAGNFPFHLLWIKHVGLVAFEQPDESLFWNSQLLRESLRARSRSMFDELFKSFGGRSTWRIYPVTLLRRWGTSVEW